jgi:hypothetical protein
VCVRITRRTLLERSAVLSAALVLPARAGAKGSGAASSPALAPERRETYRALHRALATGAGAPVSEAEGRASAAAFAARYRALDEPARRGVDVLLDALDDPGAASPFRRLDGPPAIAHLRRRARDHRPHAGGAPRSSLTLAAAELVELVPGDRADLGAVLGPT